MFLEIDRNDVEAGLKQMLMLSFSVHDYTHLYPCNVVS